MSTGVLITLIICSTIVVLLGMMLILAVVIGKREKPPIGNSTGPHLQYTVEKQEPYDQDAEPEYGVRINKNEDK